MPEYRIRHAADLLGVSTDTVRRLVEAGTLTARDRPGGVLTVDGASLARHAHASAAAASDPSTVGRSARNRFVGLVTSVAVDGVMAQVRIQSGPHTVVSLMGADSARELALEPGSLAVAVVKSTNVIVETPAAPAQHDPPAPHAAPTRPDDGGAE